jgi:hypothetical protein
MRIIGVRWSFRIPQDKDLNFQLEKVETITILGPETAVNNLDTIGSIPQEKLMGMQKYESVTYPNVNHVFEGYENIQSHYNDFGINWISTDTVTLGEELAREKGITDSCIAFRISGLNMNANASTGRTILMNVEYLMEFKNPKAV